MEMEEKMVKKILRKYRVCPDCGENMDNNGSILAVSEMEFNKRCVCGWELQGHVTSDGEIVEDYNNLDEEFNPKIIDGWVYLDRF